VGAPQAQKDGGGDGSKCAHTRAMIIYIRLHNSGGRTLLKYYSLSASCLLTNPRMGTPPSSPFSTLRGYMLFIFLFLLLLLLLLGKNISFFFRFPPFRLIYNYENACWASRERYFFLFFHSLKDGF